MSSLRTLALILCVLVLASGFVRAQSATESVPLLAHWTMDPNAQGQITDVGPAHIPAAARNVQAVPGKVGQAAQLSGASDVTVHDPGLIDHAGAAITATLWVKLDASPGGNSAGLLAKREQNVAAPFDFSLGHNGELGFEGNNGAGWDSLFSGPNVVPLGRWTQVGFAYKAGGKLTLFVDGKVIAQKDVTRALASNDQGLAIGRSPVRGPLTGAVDEVKLYAAALSPEQIGADAVGALATRPATPADFPPPTHLVQAALVRYDMPLGFQEGYGRTRQAARRVEGLDAVDWPAFTLGGKPLWAESAAQSLDVPLREGAQARPLFQQPSDEVVQPGGHWFRALQWMWGQRYVYTTDATARSWTSDYELWAFPVIIRGAGTGDVKDVTLTCDGQTLYHKAGPWRSLTLLLPQNQKGRPYRLTVAGRGPINFDAGLQPITVGAPEAKLIPVHQTLPGAGPKVTVENLDHPRDFPSMQAWQDDLKQMAAPPPPAQAPPPQGPASMQRYLGVEVPRSPLAVNAMMLPHGMSGGAFFSGSDHGQKFAGSAEDFARSLADTGYDRVFERSTADDLVQALARHGVGYGLIPDTEWGRPFLTHPNVAFLSANLPDWHAPLYRDLQLQAQVLRRQPNFAGISLGADNGAYVSFWDWAPPIPNRPWGEAFQQFTHGQTQWPTPPSLGGKATVKGFLDYVHRYDQTFRQYGYFADAVTQVDPSLTATTGSFGSSPGVGARGGWPWATIPGQAIYAGMPVQQAYDWNELSSSKPMHLEALIDRLRSYDPAKPTWAVADDFGLFLGREPRQRQYALALTRGLRSIGTTFLASTNGSEAKPQTVKDQKELYDWIHRYGGVYAGTEPMPRVGVLYVHEQALLRPTNQDANAPDAALLRGSHEGKTTEALFLCHAAGWPAKIITPEEMKRGLPPSMKAILLVGLNTFDETWHWYDGLDDGLKKFTALGGRLLLDDESALPADVQGIKAGLAVRSYITQSDTDQTPRLFARNADNVTKLRAAMQGVKPALVTSSEPTIWAVPHRTGDVEYATIVNWGRQDGQNASQIVKPQTGALVWHSTRPIYGLRLGHKLTPQEAASVDLTHDAFQLYALPPREVTAPRITTGTGPDGFTMAAVTVGEGRGMAGVPVQVTVTHGGETATVFGASGTPIRLPIRAGDGSGFTLTATELLSGLSGTANVQVEPSFPDRGASDTAAQIARFGGRKAVPLTLALTPEQAKDPTTQKLAQRLTAYFARRGRPVKVGAVAPNGVVTSLQALNPTRHFPQWQTLPTDLILLGSPRDNLLLFDQQRGGLLPDAPTPPGRATLAVTYSPFVGEYQALNVLAADPAGLAAGVSVLTK